MVTTKRNNDKGDNVQGDNHKEFPNHLIDSEVRAQGGILSSLLGEIKVNMDHHVPAVESLFNNAKDYDFKESFLGNGGAIMSAIFTWIGKYIAYFTLTFLIAYYCSGKTKGTFYYFLLISMNVLFFIYTFNDILDEPNSQARWTMAELTQRYEELALGVDELENGEEIGVNPQGGLDDNLIAGILVGVISLIMGLKPKDNGVMVMKEYLRMTPVMKNNVLTVVTNTLSIVRDLSTKFGCEKFVGRIIELPIVEERVEEFVHKVNEFINSIYTCTDGSHDKNTVLYNSFVKEAKGIEKTLVKGSLSYMTLSDLMKSLEKCKNMMNKRFASLRGYRPEPVVVFFTGLPSVMKTTLANQFAHMLNQATLPDEALEDFISNPDTYIYRKSTEKWWDGYTSKAHVTVIDDIFQVVDSGTDPTSSEGATLIKMTNSEEFAVPMAMADSKGSVFFRSGFVLATSNIGTTDLCNSIHSKDAVRRRLHFYVKVEINPKYQTRDGKIDFMKLPSVLQGYDAKQLECKKFPPDFWKLQYNEVQGSSIPSTVEEITFAELFKKVALRYYKHLKWFEINKVTQAESLNLIRQEIDQSIQEARSEYRNLRDQLRESIPMMLDVFPQSGLCDDSVEDWISCLEFTKGYQCEVYKKVYALNSEDRTQLLMSFMITLHTISPLTCWEDRPFQDFISGLNEIQVKELVSMLEDPDEIENGFVSMELYLNRIVSQRRDNKQHILTGEKLPFSVRAKDYGREISEKLGYTIHFIKNNLPLVLLAVSLSAGTAYGIYKIVSGLNENLTSQSGNTDRYISKGPNRTRTSKPTVKKTDKTISSIPNTGLERYVPNRSSFMHGEKDVNNGVITSAVDKYHFIMYVILNFKGEERIYRLGHCVNVKANKFLMPYHFILELEDYIEKYEGHKKYALITTASGSRRFKVNLNDIIDNVLVTPGSQEKDFCIVTMGYDRLAVGALKYFVTDVHSIVSRMKQFPIRIVGSKHIDDDMNKLSYRVLETNASFHKDSILIKTVWKTQDGMTHYEMDNMLKYSGIFYSGDCGSLVSLEDNSYGSKIILGIHLAGSNKYGYCSLITQGDIIDLLSNGEADIAFEEENKPQGMTESISINLDFMEPIMEKVGEFDKKFSTTQCFQTDLKKSELYDKMPFPECKNDKFPALLRPRTFGMSIIDPKRIAIDNYARDAPVIDQGVLDRACSSYFNLLNRYDNYRRDYKKDVVSVKEALHSFGDHIGSITSSTSAGWPMNTSTVEDLKKKYYESLFLNNDEVNASALEEIENGIHAIEELYDNRVRPVFIYSDSLKDETRPKIKVLEGKTRMFSGCPFFLLIMFRRYFGKFMDFYFGANLDVGSAIGINPYSLDWHELGINLTKFSNNYTDIAVGAGDYSKFDCSETPEILTGVYAVIESWYDTNDRSSMIRQYLWQEIINSKHIFGNEYYEWKNGMPSGNPMTAIINTIYNNIAFRMSFENCGFDVSCFNDNVYLCALGDDNVFTVHDDYRQGFNELTIAKAMSLIGLTYTTEIKGEATVPFRKLTEVEFLKRSFRPIKIKGQLRFLAPIDKKSIFGMINWTKKGKHSKQITVDNLSLAIRELALHGEKEYSKYVPEVKELRNTYLASYISVHPEYMSYKETLYSVLELEHYL